MHFLKTLFNRSTDTNRIHVKRSSKPLSLESLEQRIALDASGIRAQLEPVREVHIDNSLVGPAPIVFGKSEIIGRDTKSFIVTSVAAGSTVEKWDTAGNQWVDVSATVTTSRPSELIRLMRLRVIQEGDQVRWTPRPSEVATQKVFEVIGFDDGSKTTALRRGGNTGVSTPGKVENLAIDIVGGQVLVTWTAPTSGAAVTKYVIRDNEIMFSPATKTNHTFDVIRSPASYAVTVYAIGEEGAAGAETTVTLLTGSYVKNDGTVVDPIRKNTGLIRNYDGPNLKPRADLRFAGLRDANLTDANLSGANLRSATLSGATLSGANLRDANLYGAKLFGVDLSSADLFGVQSGTIMEFPSALPTHWQFISGYLTGPGANLTRAYLKDSNLAGAKLAGCQPD